MMTKQYDDIDNSQLVMCNEFLLGDILSRLPVKPLMRFKCVCKQWQTFIHKDRSFIDLHFTRSKASTFSIGGGGGGILLFIRWPRQKFFSSAKLVLSEGGGVPAVQREVPKPGASLTYVFGGVNGLLALVNRSTNCVCILNPSTGQSTPWIHPMFKQQHDRILEYAKDNWFYFGYDPAAMEHKVVLFWIKKIYDGRGHYVRSENICEVMKVDGRQHNNNNNLSWRRIELPPTISPSKFTSSVYVNGSIYWLRKCSDAEPSIVVVEYNVGSEKLRVISIPDYIIKEMRDRYDCNKLVQIDGRLALLAVRTTWLSNNPPMKMCVLYDNKWKHNIGSSVTSTSGAAGSTVGDFYWTEVTFMMPHSDWSHLQFDSIQAVPGADHLLIIKSEEEASSTFYFYDWSNKSFSKESFSIAKRKKPSSEYFVYEESLLPVI